MIEDTVYLVLNRRGVIRTGKRQPIAYHGEVLVAIKVRYGQELFENHIQTAIVNIRPDNIITTDPPVRTNRIMDVQVIEPEYSFEGLEALVNAGNRLLHDDDNETRQR